MPILTAGGHKQLTRIGEPSQAGGRGDVIHSRAASGERLGRALVPEDQSGRQRRSPLTGAAPLDRRAEIQQGVDQRDLYAGFRRVAARYQKGHSCALSAVEVGQRVDFGARFEQGLRNFNGVLRSFLPIALDAIGSHVMKERRPMHRRVKVRDTRRTGSNQFRIVAQRRPQCSHVAVDDCFHCRFELADRGILLSDRVDIFRQRRPVSEVVPTGDGELSIGKLKRGASNLGVRQLLRQPRDSVVEKSRVSRPDDSDRIGIACRPCFEEFLRLLLVSL